MSPFPGLKKRGATAVLRRPVPRYCTIFNATRYYLSYVLGSQAHGDRLLSRMRMLVAGVHFQFPVHLLAELGLRQHTEYGVLHHPGRPCSLYPADAHFHQAAGVSGEMAIDLIFFLASRELHLICVAD